MTKAYNLYDTIDKEQLIKDDYKFLTFYGGSEVWGNKTNGLLLDKLKENENVFNIRFKYTRCKK